MKITLRPHHFLCLYGYKGLNYSKSQSGVWNKISMYLEQNPESDIVIKSGNDDLCEQCPAISEIKHLTCKSERVNKLDEKVKKILQLKQGETYSYKNIITRMKNAMNVQKHQELCSECAWWKKGLCRDSFAKKE